MSFFYFLKKKERPIDNNISKQIIISVTNGELDENYVENDAHRHLKQKEVEITVDLNLSNNDSQNKSIFMKDHWWTAESLKDLYEKFEDAGEISFD